MHSIHELSRRELRLTELMVMAVNECRSHWRTLGKLVLYLGFPIEIVLQLGLSYLQNLMLQVDMDTVMQSTQNMIRFAQSSQWQAILEKYYLEFWNGRWASPEEMGYPLVAVGSRLFSYMSGQILYIDYGTVSFWEMEAMKKELAAGGQP